MAPIQEANNTNNTNNTLSRESFVQEDRKHVDHNGRNTDD